MDEALIQKLRHAVTQPFRIHGVLAAYAYGSRVSGHARPESDLDLGYYLEGYREGRGLPLEVELTLASDLSDALGVEVDLRNLADAPLESRGRVLEEGVRIFSGDDVARVGLERDLLGRYHDYKEEFLRMRELRLKRTAERGL